MAHPDHGITRSESPKPGLKYPPPLSEDQFEVLIADIKDWQITHGSLLKLIRSDEESTVMSGLVGTTLFPTLFPESLFQEACRLQRDYNKLYIAVAQDETWLYETLKELIDTDLLTNRLWTIYQEVMQQGYLQDMCLEVFRSDYMLHIDLSSPSGVKFKQVEFNTIACAGGTHSNIISSMHQHLERTGTYQSNFGSSNSTSSLYVSPEMLRSSHTVKAISSGIASAHHAYRDAQSKEGLKTCVIMIVQPHNFNIADERPIEYALWDQSIPTFRVTFGYDVLTHTTLTPDGDLPSNGSLCCLLPRRF
jgi:glutathione synthase